MTAQQKLNDTIADPGSIFGFLKLKNFFSILAKMGSNGIFLQEPTISSYKKPMSGFTRYCTTDAREHSVESFRDLVKFLLSVFLDDAAELTLVFK